MIGVPRLLAVAAAVALLAGCGASDKPSGPPPVDPSSMTDAQAPPKRLVVDVTIKEGKATPANAQLSAGIDEPIVVKVDSDSTDELHVHSTPEHSFDIAVGPAQTFQFTVDVPGRVDVELHHLNTTIATIQVR